MPLETQQRHQSPNENCCKYVPTLRLCKPSQVSLEPRPPPISFDIVVCFFIGSFVDNTGPRWRLVGAVPCLIPGTKPSCVAAMLCCNSSTCYQQGHWSQHHWLLELQSVPLSMTSVGFASPPDACGHHTTCTAGHVPAQLARTGKDCTVSLVDLCKLRRSLSRSLLVIKVPDFSATASGILVVF